MKLKNGLAEFGGYRFRWVLAVGCSRNGSLRRDFGGMQYSAKNQRVSFFTCPVYVMLNPFIPWAESEGQRVELQAEHSV